MQAVICVVSRMEHPNLVTFLGYCHERNNKCLCFELMTSGSLEERLHGKLGNQVSRGLKSYGTVRKCKSTVVLGKSWKAELLLTHSDFVTASLTTGLYLRPAVKFNRNR
jgi:serine/threonine protein kinase